MADAQLPKTKGAEVGPKEASSSLVKACKLLPIVATRNVAGVNLSTIARIGGLHPATARRLLQGLVESGLLSFDPYSKLYHIGMDLFVIAGTAGAPQQFEPLRQQLRPAMDEIAARTGDTVFLSVRVGDDSLCVDRVSGSFPISTNTLDVGSRRPLGVGAGAAALLAVLPENEQSEMLDLHQERYSRYGNLSTKNVKSMIRRMKRDNYALNKSHILPDVNGIAVAAFDAQGIAVAAISLATIKSRLQGDRVDEVLSIMNEALTRLGFSTQKEEVAQD